MQASFGFASGRYISTVPSARILIEYRPRGYSDKEPRGRGPILPSQVPTSSSGTAAVAVVAAGFTLLVEAWSEPHPGKPTIAAATASGVTLVRPNIRVTATSSPR